MSLDLNLKAVHKYRKTEKGRQNRKKYYKENLKELLLWQKQHYQENKEKLQTQHIQYYYKNHKRIIAQQKKQKEKNPEKFQQRSQQFYWENRKKILAFKKQYRQTDKGKAANKRCKARRRELGWIQLFENPFDKSEKVEWHHINNTYVVAIPKDLHRLYYGKYHREKTMEIIKQIYGGIKNDP